MSEAPAELVKIVEDQRERWAVPGVAVGVLSEGSQRTWGFGTADLETGQAVTAGTLFQVGSITKIFTTTALMQLVDAWRVDLDGPVARVLPEFSLADPEMTDALLVRHLVTHMGGFWGDDFSDFGRGDDVLANVVASLARRKQLTAPGELWHYNNTAFGVAGRIIELLARGRFESIVTDRVFRPLGLERTMWTAEQAITYPRAVPYLTDNDLKNEPARRYELPGGMNPAGAIISTVGDLLTFAAFHMGDGTSGGKRILSPGSVARMQQPQVEAANMGSHWGLGWGLREVDGRRVVFHGGAWTGFRASLLLVPDAKFAVAVLTNGANGSALYRHVNRWAMDEFAGLEDRDPSPIAMTAEELQRFAGVFTTATGQATVTVRDTCLEIASSQQGAAPLEWMELPVAHAVPVGPLEFLVTDSVMEGATFDYILNPDGSIRFRRAGGRLQIPAGVQ